MNRSNFHASWKSSASRIRTTSIAVLGKDFSLVRITCGLNGSMLKKVLLDSNGAPRAVVNSKGRRRRPGTKNLAQVLRCNDEEFVDFISRCLVWDPERRIKPQGAMRHPFITACRRN